METNTLSRESILAAIRRNLPPQRVSLPRIPAFPGPVRPLRMTFKEHLRLTFEAHLTKAGAAAHPVGSPAAAAAKLAALHPSAQVVCSAVPEIAGTRRAEDVHDPHALADVDVGVMRAQFGVAESGAVWVTQEDLIVTALGFLSQHLVVLLDPNEIVSNMHEAYRPFGFRTPRMAASWRDHRRQRILRPPWSMALKGRARWTSSSCHAPSAYWGDVSLTIYNAAAAEHGLVIGLWWFIPGMVLATAYAVFTYRHFAGKIE